MFGQKDEKSVNLIITNGANAPFSFFDVKNKHTKYCVYWLDFILYMYYTCMRCAKNCGLFDLTRLIFWLFYIKKVILKKFILYIVFCLLTNHKISYILYIVATREKNAVYT